MAQAPTRTTSQTLVDELLLAVEGQNGADVARFVGVNPGTVSRWRAGDIPRTLQTETRDAVANALRKLGAFAEPRLTTHSADGPVREDVDPLSFAAGEFDAFQRMATALAHSAGEASTRIRRIIAESAQKAKGTSKRARSADAVAATAAEALAEKKRLGVSAKHGRPQRPPKRA